MIDSKYISELISRYPSLTAESEKITLISEKLIDCFYRSGKLLVCGNGGSSADSDHVVAELMKGFLKQRKLIDGDKAFFDDKEITEALQYGFPAISLATQTALMTAFSNDCEPSLIFAQQVFVLGKKGDILLSFSTSGNSENIVKAIKTARAKEVLSISQISLKLLI